MFPFEMFEEEKFNRAFPDLDDKDLKILSVLVLTTEKIRFNELLRLVDLPKATLSEHLKSLEEEKLIKRHVEDVQRVTYGINRKSFNNFLKKANLLEEFSKYGVEQTKTFESMPLKNQLDNIYHLMVLRSLAELKAEIKLAMDRSLDNMLTLRVLSSPVFRYFELLLAFQCRKDKEYGKKALQEIDKLFEEFK